MESFSSASAPWGAFDQLTKEQLAFFKKEGIQNLLQAQLLYNRGIQEPEEMRRFLDAKLEDIPDPLLLIDMKPALERISRALREREHITVYGDFDADGVTSAALLTRAMRRLGQPASLLTCYIPSRLRGARGLSREAIDLLKERGTELIITTDCGSSDVEEVNYAQSLGLDVIITDHHHPPAQLPRATAMINPWRPDCTYNERYLCGVGIAFKLAQGLYRAAGYEQEVWNLLDLVAVGSVADVALLLGENHTLVRAGMQRLKETSNPGLDALIQVARLQKNRLRERDISFVLAPRINAAGRMEDAKLAFELLTTDDRDRAFDLARQLEELNLARQRQTEELMKLVREQAQQLTNDQVVLVYGEKENWPEGIIGLVAGKLAEEIRRPVFVLSQDSEVSRGSARGPENFNIILALQAARPNLFERFGGHAQAAGFTIANANIDELREHLQRRYEESQLPNGASVAVVTSQDESPEVVSISVETELPAPPVTRKADRVIERPERLNAEMLEKISLLSPFGAGNPEPAFQIDALLERHWLTGSERQHLRLRLSSRSSKNKEERLAFDGTLLRGAKRAESLKDGSQVRVLFSLEEAWNRLENDSRPKIWLKIVDIVPLEQ